MAQRNHTYLLALSYCAFLSSRFVVACAPGTLVQREPGAPCVSVEECDDLNSCTEDLCEDGVCTFRNQFGVSCVGGYCDEDSECVECLNASHCENGEGCVFNECAACTVDADCEEPTPCVDFACVVGTGCQFTLGTGPCDDGVACTVNDMCSGGTCGGTPSSLLCDDGNPCTSGACSSAGCMFFDNSLPCDDGISCTSDDTCADGVCQAGSDNCDEGFECSVEANQCELIANGDADNDGLMNENDPFPVDPRNLGFGPVATDITTGKAIRINASAVNSTLDCAGDRVDCNGITWLAEYASVPDYHDSQCNLNGGGENCIVAGIDAIFGCDDANTQDLFQCGHADTVSGEPELQYDFAVPNGEYMINMMFANTFSGTSEPDSRRFDILVNGQLVYDGFDQVAAAGGDGRAVVRSTMFTVSTGAIVVRFEHDKNHPNLRALEILRQETN